MKAGERTVYVDAVERLLRREDLPAPLAEAVMAEMIEGKLASAQVGAILALLAAKGETAEELAAFAAVMRRAATRVEAGDDLLDTCGTGGSGHVRTNTSTLAAFILAASGVRIAKHGNRAASGRCGSMDVLEALGVPIDLGPGEVAALLAEVGVAFMLAPRFHPAMAKVASARRELGIRTTFNFLGPLANPAGASMQVLGVSDRRRAPRMAEALRRLGTRAALVVTGADGLDEITLTGPTHAWRVSAGGIVEETIHPEVVGLGRVSLSALAGGGVDENARLFLEVLSGTETGPVRDLALVNAAAGLLVAGKVDGLASGYAAARDALASGRALAVFERYRAAAKEVSAR